MRAGLVVLGVALLVVGGVLGYVGVTATGGATTRGLESVRAISAPNIYPNQTRTDDVGLVTTSNGLLSFAWNATQSLSVEIYQGTPCGGPGQYCHSGAALAAWPANLTGLWNISGALASPMILVLTNHHDTNTSFTGLVAEEYTTVTPLRAPTWSVVAILTGAGLLVAIGGIVTFLGLFLRGGVYTEPEAVRPRYYASELDGPYDPEEEEFDDGPDGEGGGRTDAGGPPGPSH